MSALARIEVRPARPRDLNGTFGRAPLRERRLRLGVREGVVGSAPKTRRIGERYGCEKAPVVRGTVVLVEVGRLPRETAHRSW